MKITVPAQGREIETHTSETCFLSVMFVMRRWRVSRDFRLKALEKHDFASALSQKLNSQTIEFLSTEILIAKL